MFRRLLFVFSCAVCLNAYAKVYTGLDALFTEEHRPLLKGKSIGLITNHTAQNASLVHAIQLFEQNEKKFEYKLCALFAPEHGLYGEGYAGEKIVHQKIGDNLCVYSLHGETRRPTKKMLQGLDLLVYDIQDLGCRSYTFATTLFYAMEEAAKENISVVVLDRPNPINGIVVDGPMLEEQFRSFVGYLNIPYCHGMTIGELALFFNAEYDIGCNLTVIPMQGWKRQMSFRDTDLTWVPTSPNIPDPETACFYPTTGLLGELPCVSIGIGYTLPFKLIGAPWIHGEKLAKELNAQRLPGVRFLPIRFRPFFGRFAKESCKGVFIVVQNPETYLPVCTQYAIFRSLKKLYPKQLAAALEQEKNKEFFCKVCGTDAILKWLEREDLSIQHLVLLHKKEKEAFVKKRAKYLLY
jgi:uncharacterized protein YbbC (DUF1343 family)